MMLRTAHLHSLVSKGLCVACGPVLILLACLLAAGGLPQPVAAHPHQEHPQVQAVSDDRQHTAAASQWFPATTNLFSELPPLLTLLHCFACSWLVCVCQMV
jgi:hypothetical protein